MLTILFATHNGASTLPSMLESLTRLKATFQWEIIAVDNSSTDNTLVVLESFKNRLPLQIIEEPRRGKNIALNTGLARARGELIVLTDDDIIAEPKWIECLHECSVENPEFDVFGGRILPHWTVEPHSVVLENAPLGITYAITPEDQTAGPIFPGLIWGPNMAVRKRVFDTGQRFNEQVGPSVGNYIMGSETEFTLRVFRAGHKSWFCEGARVKHIIRPNQIRPTWVLKRAFRFGRNQWVQESAITTVVPLVFGIQRWRFSALANEYLSLISGIIRGDSGKIFRHRWEIEYLKGYLFEALRSKAKERRST